jgi:hypothetical protein
MSRNASAGRGIFWLWYNWPMNQNGIITQPESPQIEGVDPLTTGQTMYAAPEPVIRQRGVVVNEWQAQDPSPQHYYSPAKFKKTTNGSKEEQAEVAKRRAGK